MRRSAIVAVLTVAAVGAGTAQATRETRTPAQVVRAWSAALNANDNAAAGRLFAHDARVVQPGVNAVLDSQRLARIFNDGLPCAGRIVRLQISGSAVVATFVLGERPRHRCDDPGGKAAALFIVRGGKIVLWQQVAVPPAKTKAKGPTA